MRFRPRGIVSRRVLGAKVLIGLVAVATVVPGIAWSLWPGRSSGVGQPAMHTVERADFLHDITEQGTVESGNNVEIRCEVKNNGMTGTTILEVVPEGTQVEKDDLLMRLDSSGLESERMKQQIAVNNSEAEQIKAKVALDTATLALDEYKQGTFRQSEQAAESELFVAEETLKRAQEYSAYSARLHAKGYVTKVQLKADLFAVKKAQKDRAAAETKLAVLRDYTKAKTLTQLTADIDSATAHLKAQNNSHKLECDKLALIEDQVRKCEIRAPCSGQVVYANVINAWGDKPVVIEAGSTVRERQVMIRLPDREQIQIKARINESKIAMVARGMTATIRLDALPDVELEATVEKVEEYPAPTNRFTSSAKEYETLLRVHRPDPRLRPGLTAEVKIRIERLPSVVQAPVQAIIEHGDRHYCFLYTNGDFQVREVKIGSTNDKFVVLREGLNEDEQIVRNPAIYREKVTLPELPPEESPTLVAKSDLGKPARKGAGKPASKLVGSLPANRTPDTPTAIMGRLLTQFDKDGDGRLKPADLPSEFRTWLEGSDGNSDGWIDRTELAAAITRQPPPGVAKASLGAGR